MKRQVGPSSFISLQWNQPTSDETIDVSFFDFDLYGQYFLGGYYFIIVAYSRLGNFAARKWLQNCKVRQGIAGSAFAVEMIHDEDILLIMQERHIAMATAVENSF